MQHNEGVCDVVRSVAERLNNGCSTEMCFVTIMGGKKEKFQILNKNQIC